MFKNNIKRAVIRLFVALSLAPAELRPMHYIETVNLRSSSAARQSQALWSRFSTLVRRSFDESKFFVNKYPVLTFGTLGVLGLASLGVVGYYSGLFSGSGDKTVETKKEQVPFYKKVTDVAKLWINKMAILCSLSTIFTIKSNEMEKFAEALDSMSKIGVTQGLEILKKKNALIYEDDVNHIYQIKVTPQEENECWMHGPRNTFFLTALFSGVTESEFNELYDAMLEPKNIKSFKNKLRENQNCINAIDACKQAGFGVGNVVKNLVADGKQIPKNSTDIQKNITDFMYLKGLGVATDSGSEKKRIKITRSMIEEAEGIKDPELTLLTNEACASIHVANILPLLKKNISSLGVEMLFFITMQHSTALVISQENNTRYYFLADSFNNQNLKSSWNGRAEANIKHIKNFIENEKLLHEAQLRLKMAASIDHFKELPRECLVGEVEFFVGKMIAENFNKLDLFKNTYKPFLMTKLEELFKRFPEEWKKIEVSLKKLETV
ncbi:MAG: hypothetical protein UV38_C0002G0240 [candidate division TM6 bacterium GW2011_GWE2_42_60]|nr:MAG: hypothetical protein UV38_C0002G0240 [candidate division TM6 bacterium GW2011_GWE2_42_60]